MVIYLSYDHETDSSVQELHSGVHMKIIYIYK